MRYLCTFPNVLQTYAVNDVSFHNGWGTFATCGSDGAYNFWDKESRQRLKGFSRCNNSISCGKFNTSGTVHIHILLYSYIYQIYAYAVSYDWSKGVEQYKQTEPNYVFTFYILSLTLFRFYCTIPMKLKLRVDQSLQQTNKLELQAEDKCCFKPMLFIEIQKYILEKPLPIIHPDPLHQSVVVGYFVAV